MPRSVNAVAARARRKKMMKHAKGYFGRRKNVWTIAKNAVEKHGSTHTVIVKPKRETSVLFGLSVSMRQQDSMAYHTLNLWAK